MCIKENIGRIVKHIESQQVELQAGGIDIYVYVQDIPNWGRQDTPGVDGNTPIQSRKWKRLRERVRLFSI